MSEKSPQKLSPRTLVLLALGLATLLKIGWAVTSAGTCDAAFFFAFAEKAHKHSLVYLYQHVALFNHMPLTGWTMEGIYLLARGDYQTFAVIIRLLCVVADVLMVLALVRRRDELGPIPWWALGLFALSPVSLMVSGFHGNVDPIMTALVFFAALAAWRDRPVQCALLFGLACNVKIVPLQLTPIFFLYWCARSWRTAAQFTAIFAGLMLAGVAWPLLRCPTDFARQVLGYSSYWGTWGITYWVRLFGGENLQRVSYTDLSPLQTQLMSALKLLIIAGTLVLAWVRRKSTGRELFVTLMAVYLLVFIFAPGIGTQYMVWCAPFLLLTAPRWYLAFTVASTAFLFAFYQACSHDPFPWIVVMPKGHEIAQWGMWSTLPWLTLVAMGGQWIWRATKVTAREPALVPQVSVE